MFGFTDRSEKGSRGKKLINAGLFKKMSLATNFVFVHCWVLIVHQIVTTEVFFIENTKNQYRLK